jgi:peptidyl-prolyl cis-trans isomerase C
MMKKLFLISLALVFAVSCKGGKLATEQPKGTEGQYLAKVNAEPITGEDLRREMEMLPPQVREYFEAGGMEGILDEVVKKEILYLEAKKRGLEKDARFAERVEDFKKRMMIEFLLEAEVEKKAAVSDKEVRDFYEKNKENFVLEAPGKKGKAKAIEFERVKGLIEERLKAEKQKEIFDSYIASLKQTYKVEFNKEAIAAFENKPAAPETETAPANKTAP